MKKQMTRTLLLWMIAFILLAIAIFGGIFYRDHKGKTQNEIVLLNEIIQLTTDEDGRNPASGELAVLQEQLLTRNSGHENHKLIQICITSMAVMILWMLAIFAYIYFKILRPFDKLEQYASQIAKGNLDIHLEYERTNFFGAFTWAFDHMREEIIRARKNEADAIQENKTVIAALSHDIKTPIASIRAYAEGLAANLDTTFEKRSAYAEVIIKKCDEVTALTNDLVLHSLSELEQLEIREQITDIKEVIEATIRDLEYPNIVLQEPIPQVALTLDEKRLAQVLENLLNNAQKYAPGSTVTVSARLDSDRYEICVRDHGQGIRPEDMPFILEKFYRGRNVGDQPGSGLGLYIANYLMERMQGGLTLTNHSDGLEVIVWLPIHS